MFNRIIGFTIPLVMCIIITYIFCINIYKGEEYINDFALRNLEILGVVTLCVFNTIYLCKIIKLMHQNVITSSNGYNFRIGFLYGLCLLFDFILPISIMVLNHYICLSNYPALVILTIVISIVYYVLRFVLIITFRPNDSCSFIIMNSVYVYDVKRKKYYENIITKKDILNNIYQKSKL